MSQPSIISPIPNAFCAEAGRRKDNKVVRPGDAQERVSIATMSRFSGQSDLDERLSPLEYDRDDEESVKFFDGFQFSVQKDKEHVRPHMGRKNCRKQGIERYSINESGAVRFKGKFVDDGRCNNSCLKCTNTKKLCLRPGCDDMPDD